jgi:TM2 domain
MAASKDDSFNPGKIVFGDGSDSDDDDNVEKGKGVGTGPDDNPEVKSDRSLLITILLAIFLGIFGFDWFYLGYRNTK